MLSKLYKNKSKLLKQSEDLKKKMKHSGNRSIVKISKMIMGMKIVDGSLMNMKSTRSCSLKLRRLYEKRESVT